MSRLLVITHPTVVTGFQLAGVDAHSAEDAYAAQELIEAWLAAGETGLLAIDDDLLAAMDPALIRRLQAAEDLPYLAIPGNVPPGTQGTRQHYIAEMVRRTTGFHITFKGEPAEKKA